MSDKPINLNMIRARKANDCRLLTPLDVLEELVADIKAGNYSPSQLILYFRSGDPEKGMTTTMRLAGVGRSEQIAILAKAQHEALHAWEDNS